MDLMQSFPTLAKKYPSVYKALAGNNAFGQPAQPAPALTPTLPANYGFNDLAPYEEARRNELGQKFKSEIGGLEGDINSQYDTSLNDYRTNTAQRRSTLASSLSDTGKQTFDLQNPSILEDLNSRGVFSSPTAVSQAQAQALKEIALANQNKLNDFDTTSRGYEDTLSSNRLADLNELKQAGVSADIQSQQDALDSALDLRRGGLESKLQQDQAAKEEALARSLADKSGRNQLNNALIGVGGNILAGSLSKGGALSGLLGGGGGATGAGATGAAGAAYIPGAEGLGSAGGGTGLGVGGSLAATAGAGLLGYGVANRISPATQQGDQASENVGAGIGGVAGALIGGPAGAGLGSAAGTLAGKVENRAVEGIRDKAGNTAGEIAKYSNPIGATVGAINMIRDPKAAVNQVGKNISNLSRKVFGGGGSGSDNFETEVTPQIQEDVKALDGWKGALQSGQITEDQYFKGLNEYLPDAASNVSKHAYVSSGANQKMVAAGSDKLTEGYMKELNAYNQAHGIPTYTNNGRDGWQTADQAAQMKASNAKAAADKVMADKAVADQKAAASAADNAARNATLALPSDIKIKDGKEYTALRGGQIGSPILGYMKTIGRGGQVTYAPVTALGRGQTMASLVKSPYKH